MIDKIKKYSLLSAGFVGAMLVSYPAFADIDDTPGEGKMLGDMIVAFINNTDLLIQLVSYFAYLTGFLFTAVGLHKLRQHVEFGPQTVQLSEPLKYLFTAALMLTLPTVASVAQTTFGGVGDAQDIGGSSGSWAVGGAIDSVGLDGMLLGFIQNTYRPFQMLMEFFCFVSGAVLMVIAVHRFTKTAQQGPSGPTGLGTIVTFVLAGVLFSIGPSVGTFVETLFGTRESALSVEFMALDSTLGVTSANAENVLTAVLAFLVIVGILSMIRGFFVLRGVAEGTQGMTMMGGVSHVIAGAILVNFGGFANIIQNTLGIDAYGVLFS